MTASIRRDAIYISAVARTLLMMRAVKPEATRTIADIVAEHARTKPRNIALLFEDRSLTYREFDEGANRFAHWARAQGIRPGGVVALLLGNCPEYLMAWLGMIRVGAVTALVNSNLRGQALAHSIDIVQPKLVIAGADLAQSYLDVETELAAHPAAWSLGARIAGMEDLDEALAAASAGLPDAAWRGTLTLKDRALLVYTSGTTGLPKAANISHMRVLFMMMGFDGALNAKDSDRLYNVLPLYHAAGGIAALGPALIPGGSLVIRRKFSVHEFWDDCFRYRPTFFQYIGEICRYLLNAPQQRHERNHNLRAIIGNGLRPDIWEPFERRFAIPRIVEFYGATEGNVSFINYDGRHGAVGRLPWYARGLIGTRIVRFDIEREEPIRGRDGLCIECEPNEVGEAIGRIDPRAGRNFEGYTKSTETEKKILRDAFKRGDAWFRTGDLMKRDAQGYIFFIDRIGDTFRWKGENVATSEVSEALGIVPGIKEANVYGVPIPEMDGHAGMAAIVVDERFEISNLATVLSQNLPSYALPLFIRIQPEIEITGTYKHRKLDLVREGFNPDAVSVPVYWLRPGSGHYEKLSRDNFAAIAEGKVRL